MSFVLTESHDINSVLLAPINTTQRIKYTCLDASSNFLALGSTSGSIYLFSREPCSFLQLIPLSQGPVTRLRISPDEKLVAFSTTRGTVCLVTLRPSAKLITVSNEHIGERVECLCWNENSSEVYVGDAKGKISVLVVSIFTVNGIFQATSCGLMDLDSSVVQMSFESPMLLISTLTRCYLCNTNLEQFKQIGNQFRDGEYGACFYKVDNTRAAPEENEAFGGKEKSGVKRAFDLIAESNDYAGASSSSSSKALDENVAKIFCARPSSRLWEVDPEGTVVKTHQFKDALAVAPRPVHKIHCPESLRFEDEDEKATWPPKSTQFLRLYVIRGKFIFSYSTNGLYILDPTNALVVLWSDEFANLDSAHVVDDKIYLMSRFATFYCIQFTAVQDFILQLYERKLSQLCRRAVQIFKPELIDQMENEELATLMNNLRVKCKEDTGKKSGIVSVNSREIAVSQRNYAIEENSSSSSSSTFSASSTPSSTCSLSDIGNGQSRQTEIRDALCQVEADLEGATLTLMNDLNASVTEEEFLEAISKLRESVAEIKSKFADKLEMQDSLLEMFRSVELHCDGAFLESVESQDAKDALRKSDPSGPFVDRVSCIFLDLLASYPGREQGRRCCDYCKFPRSRRQALDLTKPKFLEIGKILIEKFVRQGDDERCADFCSRMPILWRTYVTLCDKRRFFASGELLKLALGTNDAVVFAATLSGLDKKRWSAAAPVLKRIQDGGVCLSCGKGDEKESSRLVDWGDVAIEVVRLDGPEAALQFLAHLNQALPGLSIGNSVFRKIVFSKILKHHGRSVAHVVDFENVKNSGQHSICSNKVKQDLAETLSRDTERGIVEKSAFGSGPHHWGMLYKAKSWTCPCCTLSLHTPVLLGKNGLALFKCGHAYHVNCLIKKKITKCNLHATK